MTGSKGNSEFCFPETLNVEALRVEGKQKSLFPEGPVTVSLALQTIYDHARPFCIL